MANCAGDSDVCDDFTYVEEFDAICVDLKTSLSSKYPAKQHARSVAKHLGVKDGLIYLRGRPSSAMEDSDMPKTWRQRRYFFYITGVDFADCVVTYDIGADSLRLFVPTFDDVRQVIYFGTTPSIKECEEKYDVDIVQPNGEINDFLVDWLYRHEKPTIYILHDDQGPRMLQLRPEDYALLGLRKVLNSTLLLPAMDAARVIKSEYEVALIRKANDISSWAHKGVLHEMAEASNETHIEATFLGLCVFKGAKKQAYNIIAGSGENASTLHYDANDQPLEGKQLVCLDAGCEWNCYASDITRTFPISGTFTQEAHEIYTLVQEMQEECIKRIKPGVAYHDLQVLAMDIAVMGLLKLGVLHNGNFRDVYNCGRIFFPHGLGHHVGLEVHDVSAPERLLLNALSIHQLGSRRCPDPDSLYDGYEQSSNKLYAGQQKLEPNMIVTVEPGIYFSRFALEEVFLKDPAYAKYINTDILKKYYPVGGVRIEDDILVTKDGYENLSTAPKGEEACEIIRNQRSLTPGQRVSWKSQK